MYSYPGRDRPLKMHNSFTQLLPPLMSSSQGSSTKKGKRQFKCTITKRVLLIAIYLSAAVVPATHGFVSRKWPHTFAARQPDSRQVPPPFLRSLPVLYDAESKGRSSDDRDKRRSQEKKKSKNSNRHEHKPLDDDIARRLSLSKNRAISALSRPKTNKNNSRATDRNQKGFLPNNNTNSNNNYRNRSQLLPPPPNENNQSSKNENDNKKTNASGNRSGRRRAAAAAPSKRGGPRERTSPQRRKSNTGSGAEAKAPRRSSNNNNNNNNNKRANAENSKPPPPPSTTYSSLLPPPLTSSSSRGSSSAFRGQKMRDDGDDDDEEDPLSSGLSSWEEFLGVSGSNDSVSSDKKNTAKGMGSKGERSSSATDNDNDKDDDDVDLSVRGGDDLAQRLPSIQDLFPPDISSPTKISERTGARNKNRNSFSGSKNDGGDAKPSSSRPHSQVALEGVLPVSDLFYRSSSEGIDEDEEHDDEELPFSAEQSDAVISDNNKVRIRRNLAQQSRNANKNTRNTRSSNSNANNRSGRKMVRRGMEMLVGGVPINADPPQRSVELLYNADKDWASVISLNTRDFGPLLYGASIPKVSLRERALYTEFWSRSALKWDICPPDIRDVIKSQALQLKAKDIEEAKSAEERKKRSQQQRSEPVQKDGDAEEASTRRAYRSGVSASSSKAGSVLKQRDGEKGEYYYETEGECTFEVGLSREEIESAPSEIFVSVFGEAFVSVIEKAVMSTVYKKEDFAVEVTNLHFTETDDGYTDIHVGFQVLATAAAHNESPTDLEVEKRTKIIHEALQQAMDDGEIAIALAAAAQEETRWPDRLRDRIVEECLFQDDDEVSDVPAEEYSPSNVKKEDKPKSTFKDETESTKKDPNDGPFELGSSLYAKEDLFLGGGNDGVFFDFSEANAHNAPYGGEIGLRLVDSLVERAKQRQPRVIAIGDVHGCIDELQDLLRECDYRPGDLVVFLGDLVCKGPDSISVVQMAREIGAIGVRGNHDFEVVRWHQAIKSGVDAPVVGSEHFHIASCLNKADMKWMYSLPWYISSKDLGTLFVHAGFVSGIRLAKQNPRLMMNMRSILPDGTVTSKFFNNWPWARLWDGPQTVLFGHDADRGLQQYEHAIGLDTGCVYGGRLTACILPEKRLVSVSARREYFKYRRKHYD